MGKILFRTENFLLYNKIILKLIFERYGFIGGLSIIVFLSLLFLVILFIEFLISFYNGFKSLILQMENDNILSSISIDNQLLYSKIKVNEINQPIISVELETFLNKISIKKTEILKLFLFLNNTRLLLFSRKYINNLIKIIIRNNKNLRISQ